jgi:mono/diheme cytochrome c family protein
MRTHRAFLLLALPLLAAAAARAAQSPQDFAQIEQGRAVAIAADCGGCHTMPGGPPFAGGVAVPTPFGTLLASNITPDRATGIGGMTDAEFASALRQGVTHGGEHLYPAMPYPSYTKLSDEDVAALRAYLATVEPVEHRVVSNQLSFPYNMRWLMRFWNTLFFDEGRFRPDPNRAADWNRGAYLVQSLGHCGTCHTPKNWAGAERSSEALQGAPLEGWFAPNLTRDPRRGLAAWSEEDLLLYLKTGRNRFDIASGPMAEAIERSTSKMPMDDLRAIAVYLHDVAGNPQRATPIAGNDPHMKAGAVIFRDQCAACHTQAGTGIVQLFPRLAGAPLTQQDDATSLVHVVLHGSRAGATEYAPTAPAMPAFDWKLDDQQIADVLTYVRNSWGNAASAVSASDVASARSAQQNSGMAE